MVSLEFVLLCLIVIVTPLFNDKVAPISGEKFIFTLDVLSLSLYLDIKSSIPKKESAGPLNLSNCRLCFPFH